MARAPWYVRAFSRLMVPGPSMTDMTNKLIWQGDLQGCFDDPDKVQQVFVQWNEDVKKVRVCGVGGVCLVLWGGGERDGGRGIHGQDRSARMPRRLLYTPLPHTTSHSCRCLCIGVGGHKAASPFGSRLTVRV